MNAQATNPIAQPDGNTVEPVRSMTNKQIVEELIALRKIVEELQAAAAAPAKADGKEMTDADAESVTYGDLAEKKHGEAAEALGLTYGQVYSCRKEFTFKTVHKAAKEANRKNRWVK